MDLNKIIDGCIKNDQKSQEELYKHFFPAFFSLCKSFFEDKHDILTALNNGMLRVFRHIDQYQPEKGTFFTWAYTIIRNEALSLIRNKKPNLTYELSDATQEANIDNPFRQFEWNDIYYYLGKLPTNTRYVCTLYYLEGFSIKEIATSIDMKEGTVKWHLSECRSKLKEIFENKQRNSG